MKRIAPILITFGVLLAFAGSFLLVRYGTGGTIDQNKWNSKAALSYLRGKINEYHETTGEFPPSLAEMEARFAKKTGERWGPSKEWISSYNGDGRESDVLDGRGGWYYNRKTGELRINLNRRLKDYLRHYYRRDRNERPCDW